MPDIDKTDTDQQRRKGVIIHACLLAAVAVFVYVGFYFLVSSHRWVTMKHGKTVGLLGVATIAMFGFGFALVPLYDMLCNITGLNGKSESIITAAEHIDCAVDEERLVTVQFLTDVNSGMPWEFSAQETRIKVHPGKLNTVMFSAVNRSGKDMVGQAVPSLRPTEAAGYLRKTECFCFRQQTFEAGESRDMPMRFVIDPELPDRERDELYRGITHQSNNKCNQSML